MKRVRQSAVLVLVGVLLGAGALLAILYGTGALAPPESQTTMLMKTDLTETDDLALLETATHVAQDVYERDFAGLSAYVSASRGVVFAAYSRANLEKSLTFSAGQVSAFADDASLYVWDVVPATGEPVERTASAFFEEFLCVRDFCKAPTLVRGRVSAVDSQDPFASDVFVEFQYGAVAQEGWTCLRLVFETTDSDTYALTAIIRCDDRIE